MKPNPTRMTRCSVLLALAMIIFVTTDASAQEGGKFASKGTTELGGSISFQSTTPVSRGSTGDALTILSFQPFIGYFITDGFELGLNPLGITSISYFGSSATSISIFLAPSYNFQTDRKGIAYPFLEALLGYTSTSNGSTASGFSWGGRAGVKLAVTGKGLLNFGVQYLQITLNREGETERTGTNQFAISAGFTVWL